MISIPAWPSGYALKKFEEIDSTNEEARRRAVAGEPGPVWFAAKHQTAGRGRRGREWVSPAGNLAATLLLRPGRTPGEAAQLSFVAALAATETVESFAHECRIQVKWPNDILADGRKISGVLLESVSSGAGKVDWLAVGIGINLASHPEGVEFPATSLAALGEAVPTMDDALHVLASVWVKWYVVWMASGFGPIRDAWLVRAASTGGRIRVRLGNGEISGVFEGIDETGALILRESQDRTRIIAAGEVFF